LSILNELRLEKTKLERRLAWVNEGIATLSDEEPDGRRQKRARRTRGKHKDKGKMSAATRKKLSIAAKERWAKVKGKSL